jgi:hypothetical protein
MTRFRIGVFFLGILIANFYQPNWIYKNLYYNPKWVDDAWWSTPYWLYLIVYSILTTLLIEAAIRTVRKYAT